MSIPPNETFRRNLEKLGMSQGAFIAEAQRVMGSPQGRGEKFSQGQVSRWISGKETPGPIARAIIQIVTGQHRDSWLPKRVQKLLKQSEAA